MKQFILLFGFVAVVNGHGYMSDPPNRSSVWRYWDTDPAIIPYKDIIVPNYNDNQNFCGGLQHQLNQGYKCGICGDAYDAPQPRDNEGGGTYGKGIIVRQYQPGQVIKVDVMITAYHKGYFEFRLCPWNNQLEPATQECFDSYLLPTVDQGTQWMLEVYGGGSGRIYEVPVQLPEGLICDQCVLQWRYHTGNNWGCDEDGSCCTGCGPQEEFYSCSDIAIGDGPTLAPPSAEPQQEQTTTEKKTTTKQHFTTTTPSISTTTTTPTTTTTTTPTTTTTMPTTTTTTMPTTTTTTTMPTTTITTRTPTTTTIMPTTTTNTMPTTTIATTLTTTTTTPMITTTTLGTASTTSITTKPLRTTATKQHFTTTTPSSTTTTPSATERPYPTTTTTTTETGECETEAPNQMYQESCTEYYICTNGKKDVFDCPPGTVYDEERSLCDFAYNVPPPCGTKVPCEPVLYLFHEVWQ